MPTNRNRKSFEDYNYEDWEDYKKRLLILLLKLKLELNDQLKPEDITESYHQRNGFVSHDLEFLARKQCPVLNHGEKSGDPLRCRLKQLDDVVAMKRAAMVLVNKTKPYIVDSIYGQPKSLQDIRKTILTRRVEGLLEIRSRHTVGGMVEQLIEEMSLVDEKMSLVFESLISDLGPKLDLKLKKYYDQETLGRGQCKYCSYPWFQDSNELEREFMKEPVIHTADDLERFCCASFRWTFYENFLQFVKEVPID